MVSAIEIDAAAALANRKELLRKDRYEKNEIKIIRCEMINEVDFSAGFGYHLLALSVGLKASGAALKQSVKEVYKAKPLIPVSIHRNICKSLSLEGGQN